MAQLDALSQLFVTVDSDLDIPPYQQIREQITAAIQRGDLAAGAMLPSVRQLADDLGVAPNTVVRAYNELQSDGWIISERRRGTQVVDRIPTANKRGRTNLLRESAQRFVALLSGRGYSEQEIFTEIKRLTSTSR